MDFAYDDDLAPPAPVISARLGAPGRPSTRAVRLLVDTGADGSVVPAALARALGLPAAGAIRVTGISGQPVVARVFRCVIRIDERELHLRVVALGEEAILGRDALAELVVRLDGPRGRLRVTAPKRRR